MQENASIADAAAALEEEFAFLEDWRDKVEYLIDLGRDLPPLPEALKVERHKVRGCQSQVCWWPSLRRRSPMVPKPPKATRPRLSGTRRWCRPDTDC